MTIHSVHRNMYVDNYVIDYRDRPEGSVSKLNTYSDGMKVSANDIVRLYRNYKPLSFFSVISVIMAAVSVGFVISIFVTFANTGEVQDFLHLSCADF